MESNLLYSKFTNLKVNAFNNTLPDMSDHISGYYGPAKLTYKMNHLSGPYSTAKEGVKC